MIDEDGGGFQLQSWDWWYYAERVKKAKYDLDEEMLRPYFELDRVLAGMFDLTALVFGLAYEEVPDAQAWHEDVTFYRIRDAGTGEHLAYFYADLFPREGKYSHAAAFPLYPGHLDADGTYRRPVSAMVANLTAGRPSCEAELGAATQEG